MTYIQPYSLLDQQELATFRYQEAFLPLIEVPVPVTELSLLPSQTAYAIPEKIANAFERAITIPSEEQRNETIADISILLTKKHHYLEAYTLIKTAIPFSKSATRALQKLFTKMIRDQRLANEEFLTDKIAQSSGDVDLAWLSIVKKLLKIGKPEKASQFFQKIHSQKYRDEASGLIAVDLAKRGNMEEALLERGKITDADARSQLDVSLVEILTKNGQFPEALHICEGLKDEWPDKLYRIEALSLVARELTWRGMISKAMALAHNEEQLPYYMDKILQAIFRTLIPNNDQIDTFIKMAVHIPDGGLRSSSVYISVVGLLVDAKFFDKAYLLLTQLKQNVFGTSIDGDAGNTYAKNLRPIAAHMLKSLNKTVDQMVKEIPCPMAVHPNDFKGALIAALIDAGQFSLAKERMSLWCDIEATKGWTEIACAFAEKQCVDAFTMMETHPVSKNGVASAIVRAWCKKHLFDAALNVLPGFGKETGRGKQLFDQIVVSIAKVDLAKAGIVVNEKGPSYYKNTQDIAEILAKIARERIYLSDFHGAYKVVNQQGFHEFPNLTSPLLHQIAVGMTKASLDSLSKG